MIYVEFLIIKRHKKQTFVEVELERVFGINCRFIRESSPNLILNLTKLKYLKV